MPDFDITLVIKDGQAIGKIRQVRSELDNVERSATRVSGVFRNLFAGIGVGFAVREFINLSNASVGIENRLKLVSDTIGDTEVAFQRLRDISRATRSPLEENVALFQRAAQAQRELGATNEDLYKFVQATGTALAIQGGSTNTARGALIQLSQSIGATIVRAEEFNSILEGALPLAQAAARGIDEAGGSVSRLRQLVLAGEISSKEFFQAIVEQQAFLEEAFAKTTPTIAQAFQVLKNEAIATFRSFDEGTGITLILSNAMLFLADNLDTIARVLAAGAIVAGIYAIYQGLMLIPVAIKAITLAMATNPIGLFLIAVTTGISLLITFADKMKLFGEGAATVADLLGVVFNRSVEAIKALFAGLFAFIPDGWAKMIPKISFADALFFIARQLDKLVAIWNGIIAAISAAWDAGWRGLVQIVIKYIGFIIDQFDNMVNLIIKGLNALGGNIAAIDLSGSFDKSFGAAAGTEVGDAFSAAYNGSLERGAATAAVESSLVEAANNARIRETADALGEVPPAADAAAASLGNAGGAAGGASKSFADLYAELELQAEALTKLGQEQDIYNEQMRIAEAIGRNLSAAEAEAVAQMVKKIEVLQTASDIYDEINGRVRDYINTQGALQSLLDSGAISQVEADFALAQSSLVQDLRSTDESLGFQFGFQAQIDAIREYVNERTIILQQARDVDLINEEQYQARLRALTLASQREILDAELGRWDLAISSAQESVDVLLKTAEDYAGKQSGIYKGIFVAQKALAIAEATVNTFRAISNALAAPFPPPIPQTLAAAAAVAGGAQVAAIVASTITGLANGGRVTGPGGPRDDAAGLFALSNGEFVVNAEATKANLPLLEAMNNGIKIGRMRDGGRVTNSVGSLQNAGRAEVANAQRSAPSKLPDLKTDVQVPVNVITVRSQDEALAALGSREGKNILIQTVEQDRRVFRSILGLEN
jgi:tape measure domain-containing protein